jgi:hypothetical protein
MAGGGRVRIDRRKWGAYVSHVSSEATDRAAERLRGHISHAVRATGRVNTGRLSNDWHIDPIPSRTANGARRRVYTKVPYVWYQNDGTRGSAPIPPKKAIKFQAGGKLIFRKKSGPIAPANFMQRARASVTIRDWLP